MAWTPISHTVVQYVDGNGDNASGFILKAYASGTTNNISMAIDSAGATTAATIALNAAGYPEVSGNVVIPYVEEKYKLALYTTQAAADSDTGAIWEPDAIPIAGEFGSVTQDLSTNTVLDASDAFNNLRCTSTITVTLPDVDTVGAGFVFTAINDGTGVITFDGNGSETINGALTLTFRPGDSGTFISSSTNWSAIGMDVPMQTVAVTSSSNATTINSQLGDVFSHTFTENTTFTFSNPNATGIFTGFALYLTNDGTGRTPTWPASVDWPNGATPDLTTASEVNILVFTTIDGGTIWHGKVSQKASA